jgi:hypothetical protein
VAHRSRVFWPSFPNDTSRKPLFSWFSLVSIYQTDIT